METAVDIRSHNIQLQWLSPEIYIRLQVPPMIDVLGATAYFSETYTLIPHQRYHAANDLIQQKPQQRFLSLSRRLQASED